MAVSAVAVVVAAEVSVDGALVAAAEALADEAVAVTLGHPHLQEVAMAMAVVEVLVADGLANARDHGNSNFFLHFSDHFQLTTTKSPLSTKV